ncbi:hypothetical protein CFIMG_004553RA [Ceratocystis fimbriata CBS 114723]|uniref:Uncharacterized protein n=1 Tax=Ceratocystis fimbriata CBS 114723 TaxID=1035309 RepID=A0A2C5WXV6_9PEZI|nr:hypothetical protein CFIMG_004553RA [Ceratocystis fimbriata CBS 114723]
MKFSFSLLPVAWRFFSLVQAGIIEDHGSEFRTKDHTPSLEEIYSALCEKQGFTSDGMNWPRFDVQTNSEDDKMVGNPCGDRNLRVVDEVRLVPGDKEWDWILRTEHYQKMQQFMNKPVRQVLIRCLHEKSDTGYESFANSIHFSFLPPEDTVSYTEAGPLSDG